MATRRKTRGSGGSSGGANPRNKRENSEAAHEDAMLDESPRRGRAVQATRGPRGLRGR